MTVRDQEKMEGILRRFYSRRTTKASRSDCPNEELLADYLDRGLDENEAMRIEKHLAGCALCMEDIVAVYKSTQGTEGRKVPQPVIDRVLSLIQDSATQWNVLDLVVRLVKDSLELVSTSGRLVLTAPPLSVRARPKTLETTILQVEKEIAEFKITLEVEPVEAGLCQVVVRTEAQGKGLADGIRLSLFCGDREQASYLTRRGQAVFDRIPVGIYNVAVSNSHTAVGTIRLVLMN